MQSSGQWLVLCKPSKSHGKLSAGTCSCHLGAWPRTYQPSLRELALSLHGRGSLQSTLAMPPPETAHELVVCAPSSKQPGLLSGGARR